MPNRDLSIPDASTERVLAYLLDLETKAKIGDKPHQVFFALDCYKDLEPIPEDEVVTILEHFETNGLIDKIYPYGTMPCAASITLDSRAYTYFDDEDKAAEKKAKEEAKEKLKLRIQIASVAIAAFAALVSIANFLTSNSDSLMAHFFG